jgi:hypothetical protein
MRTAAFWVATAERSLKTFAQALLAIILGSQTFDLFNTSWGDNLKVALTATLISVLTSVVSAQVGPERGSPSLVAEPVAEGKNVV